MRRGSRPVGGLLAAAVLLALAACSEQARGEELRSDAARHEVSLVDAQAVPAVVGATTALGAGLLAAGPEGENLLVSPVSVAIALSMLAEGARGATAGELDALLGATGQDRTDAVGALQAALAVHDGDPSALDEGDLPERPLLHVANRVVVDESRDVEPAFLDALATGYGAGLSRTELSDGTGKAVLDAWVAEHTAGLVESSGVEPDPDLVLVLQNAVLLAARWQAPFDPQLTAPRDFTPADGRTVQVETMLRQGPLAYTDDGPWQAVRLPYTEAVAMDVVLPGGPPASLTPADWADLDAALSDAAATEVRLALPRVDVKTSADLRGPLGTLGLSTAFSRETADLTGIAPDLHVSTVVHHTVLRVDEEGTVAAAVTEIGAEAGTAQPPDAVDMTVDRPFAVRIVHLETGLPLFLGVIADPRG